MDKPAQLPGGNSRTISDHDGLLRAAFDALRAGVCVVDAGGCFVMVNPAFCSMTGFSTDELIGRPWTVAAPEEIAARAERFLPAVLADSAHIPDHWKIRRKDGMLFDALVSFRPLSYQGGKYAVLSFSDITEAKRADDEIRDLKRDLEHALLKRTELLRRNRNVLLELAALDKSNRAVALQAILGASARTMGVERVSYWRLANDRTAIECEMLFALSRDGLDTEFAGTRLDATRFPRYFAAIIENRPVVAPDAQTHDATAEFTRDYLIPRGITSMLDAPVWLRGQVVGVICHEHVGAAREWTPEEVDFGSSMATMISLTLEAARRHELNEELARSEEKYRHVIENANEAIVIAQDGRIRYANPQTSRLSGYSPEELHAKSFLDFVYDEDKALVGANYMKRMRGEPAESSYDFRIVDKQGTVRWLNINAVSLDWEGRPATLNFLTDISENKKLQQSLQRNLAEREALLQSALVGITFAVDRHLTWVNETYARMLGYRREELIDQKSLVHFPDTASYEAFGANAYPVLASGKPFEAEQQMRRKDGSLIWVHLHGIAVDPSNLSKGTIWTNIDITERRRAVEEIRRALDKERELNELKSRFVAMTSHEFRTPLATILSSAELLDRHHERLSAAERHEIFGRIGSGVERMARMLDNVLTIGQAETHAMDFSPARIDLPALCRSLVEEARVHAGPEHHLEFVFQGESPEAALDEKLLRHALGNLLLNALKYSPRGGRVDFRASLDAGKAVFEIADQGIGIPKEDHARMFDAFHRAANVGNISGTGLGLAIVKKSIDLHGGDIAFESNVGRGTRFIITLPLGKH